MLVADSPTWDGGGTNRVLWEQLAARGKQLPEAAIRPELPPEWDQEVERLQLIDALPWLVSIQAAFYQLSRRRTYGANAPNPITFGDVIAYQQLNRLELHPIEVGLISDMDNVFVDHAIEELEATRRRAEQGRK